MLLVLPISLATVSSVAAALPKAQTVFAPYLKAHKRFLGGHLVRCLGRSRLALLGSGLRLLRFSERLHQTSFHIG
jgi:hypothetical protein